MPCICACNNMYYYLLTSSGWHRENYAKIYFINVCIVEICISPLVMYKIFLEDFAVRTIEAGARDIKSNKGKFVVIFLRRYIRMARISGVDLPRDKRIEIGLTYIYGIGRTSATRILKEANVSPDTRVRDLTDEEVKKLSEIINETQVVEGDLRREIALNIKRLQEIGCYRGIRHRKGLPVRGQKTKTNARTRKGPKKTVANKKK